MISYMQRKRPVFLENNYEEIPLNPLKQTPSGLYHYSLKKRNEIAEELERKTNWAKVNKDVIVE